MSRVLIALTLSMVLTACEQQKTAVDYIDTEEKRELFIECMKLVPQYIASNRSVVSDCESYAWNTALSRASDRMKKGEHP